MISNLRPYLPTTLFALLIFYFGCQAMTGERGILTGPARDEALADRNQTLKRLHAERTDLETRVHLLSDADLSRDLLDERSRIVLGYADPGDYVIRTGRHTD